MKRNNLFNKRLLVVSVIIYLIFACVIVQSVYVFRNFYRQEENVYIEEIQEDIHAALKKDTWIN